MRALEKNVEATLRDAASGVSGLAAIWLFGSGVRSESPRDIDLALLWSQGTPLADRWRQAEALAIAVERATGLTVDLVDLESAPPALLVRALSEGRLLVEVDRVARVRFQADAGSRAIDFVEWQRPYLERWLRRVADGR